MCILFYGVKRVAFNYKYYFDFEVFFGELIHNNSRSSFIISLR